MKGRRHPKWISGFGYDLDTSNAPPADQRARVKKRSDEEIHAAAIALIGHAMVGASTPVRVSGGTHVHGMDMYAAIAALAAAMAAIATRGNVSAEGIAKLVTDYHEKCSWNEEVRDAMIKEATEFVADELRRRDNAS